MQTHYVLILRNGVVLALRTYTSEFAAQEAFLAQLATNGVPEVAMEVVDSGHYDCPDGETTVFWGSINEF